MFRRLAAWHETKNQRRRFRPALERLEDRLTPASAFLRVLDVGHADVGIALEDDGTGTLAWNLHVHDEELDVEYAADQAMLRVGPGAEQIRPAGSQWDFLGAAAGAPVWILPMSAAPSLLFLGIGSEEIAPGILLNDQLTLSLKAVSGPGHFAAYETDLGGTPTALMDSNDGFGADDDLVLGAGAHQHVNWAFTQAGLYEVTFEVAGTLADGTPIDPVQATCTFFVAQDVLALSVVIDHEHTDLRFDRNADGLFVLGKEYRIEQDDATDLDSAASQTLVWAGADAEVVLPAGSTFAFTGAAPGDTVWILPQVQNHDVAWLGFSTEHGPSAPPISTIPIRLRGVRGPGELSMYTSGAFGTPTVYFASADGLSAADVYPLPIPAHAHVNWVFTKPGFYEIDLEATADYGGGNVQTKLATYYFAIGLDNLAPVHELPVSVQQGGDATTAMDADLHFAGENALTVSGPEAHPNPVDVRLQVAAATLPTAGVLKLSSLTGLTLVAGSNGSTDITVRGTLDAVNAALATLRYTPPAGASGAATFTITTNDNGYLTTDLDDDDLPDNAQTTSDSFTIVVVAPAANIAPEFDDADDPDAYAFSLNENSANGTAVGTAAATDPDVEQSLTYAITGGNGSGAFAISSSGVITVANSALLNFETTPVFTLTVTVTDNGTPALSDTATVTINLNNVNEAPEFSDPDNPDTYVFSVPENSANGTVVGAAAAADPDAGQTLTYAITGGNSSGAFAINALTGAITVANSALLDSETTPVLTLTVTVTDNAGTPLSDTATVTINVTNVNETPVFAAWSSLSGFVKQLVATQNVAGNTVLFGIGGDNAAWMNDTVTGWTSLGGFVKQLAVTQNAAGNPVLFAIGGDNAAWMNDTVSGWTSLGGYVKQLAVTQNAASNPEVFAIGGDNAAWRNATLAFGAWTSLGGFVKQLAVTQNAGTNAPIVFAIGGDNAAWRNEALTQTGWISGGGFVKQLAVGRAGNGAVSLFAIGGDNALWVNTTFDMTGWSSLGGFVKQIAVERGVGGTLAVFAIGGDDAAWVRTQNSLGGAYDPWTSLGGFVKLLATAHKSNGKLDLFAIGGDNAAWLRRQV